LPTSQVEGSVSGVAGGGVVPPAGLPARPDELEERVVVLVEPLTAARAWLRV
jgi:hypothetical protein